MNELEITSASQIGFQLLKQGRTDEALAVFRGLVRLAPSAAYPHYGMAMVLRETAQPERAIEHAREAANLEPRPEFVLLMAELELDAGNGEAARTALSHVKQKGDSAQSRRASVLIQQWFS